MGQVKPNTYMFSILLSNKSILPFSCIQGTSHKSRRWLDRNKTVKDNVTCTLVDEVTSQLGHLTAVSKNTQGSAKCVHY